MTHQVISPQHRGSTARTTATPRSGRHWRSSFPAALASVLLGAAVTARAQDLPESFKGTDLRGEGLYEVVCDDDPPFDVGAIPRVAELKALYLSTSSLEGTPPWDLPPLAAARKLRTLDVMGGRVTGLGGLSRLPALQGVLLVDTEVQSLEGLRGVNSLRAIYWNRNVGLTRVEALGSVGNLEHLRGLRKLEVLYLARTRVKNLAQLVALSALESLVLADTLVTDVSPLAAMKRLRRLSLAGTSARFGGLRHPTVESLNLSRTTVTDFGFLAHLLALTNLNLYGTSVSPSLVAALQRQHPRAHVSLSEMRG